MHHLAVRESELQRLERDRRQFVTEAGVLFECTINQIATFGQP